MVTTPRFLRSFGWHDDGVREVFRPTFGRVLTIAVGACCALALVVVAVNDPDGALLVLPWLALVAGGCWALFWRPHVVVEDSGVRLVNPFRTVVLPWPSIHAVDTKLALTLMTAYGCRPLPRYATRGITLVPCRFGHGCGLPRAFRARAQGTGTGPPISRAPVRAA